MLFFNIGVKIILAVTIIFFIVFFWLCFAWSDMHRRGERLGIAAVVSFLYSFVVFFVGVLVVAAVSLVWEYLPKLF